MKLRQFDSIAKRRQALEKELALSLVNIGSFSLAEEVAAKRNCENMIGATQVPLGVAGPLVIQTLEGEAKSYYTQKLEVCLRNADHLGSGTGPAAGSSRPTAFLAALGSGARRDPLRPRHPSRVQTQVRRVYIPLATTEGALVASVNRGCKAITESGGAAVTSERVGATRGPVFRVANLRANRDLGEFLRIHFQDLKKAAEATSGHLTLTKLSSQGVGKHRYVRFYFDTEEAMGMNMATIAAEAMARLIEAKTGSRCVSVSGNYCVDKKPAWQNSLNGRGFSAQAEVTIPAMVLKQTLKTTAQAVTEVWSAKLSGGALAGSMGFNAQYANVVAAIFLATGQDLGHVSEGCLGMTTAEPVESLPAEAEDLYLSVYLPDLMVGTVGGGTGLATQQEALSILGLTGGQGGENAKTLAEVIAAAVMAGEVSLLAALAEGTLARSHRRFARGIEEK